MTKTAIVGSSQQPIRILTSESNSLMPEWKNSQESLKEWSTDSKQMIVKGSRHSIHHYSPDIVNIEIINLKKVTKFRHEYTDYSTYSTVTWFSQGETGEQGKVGILS